MAFSRKAGLVAAIAAGIAVAQPPAARAATAGPPARPVKLVVTLKLHRAADLSALVANQSDPRSPLYAHFLTPEGFRATYAPSAQEYAATATELAREGFSIDRRYAGRTVLDVSGDPATVERRFGVKLHVAGFGAAARYIADRKPAAGAKLPAVAAVAGLEPDAIPEIVRSSAPVAGTRSAAPTATAGGFPTVGPDNGYSPAALSRAYDLPLGHGYDGTGTAVADLVDGFPDAGLAVFLKRFGLAPASPAPKVVAIDGGGGQDNVEADYDFEWLYATAPGATMYDYEIPALSIGGILDGLGQIVSDDKVDVVNISFAACENFTTLAYGGLPLVAQAAAEGIAFESIAFGGSAYCGFQGIAMPQFPADGPDGLAVGGNSTITNPSGAAIGVSGYVGSGGGVSLIVPLPPAQKGVGGITPGGRNVPDITLPAEIDGSGPSWNYETYWVGGGPSINAPAAGGMLAEFTQMAGHRLGAFDRTLYALFKANGYGSAITDITVGCSGTVGTTTVCAGPNYDRTSGLGSLDAYALGKLLGGSK
jgi:kumamolisin